MNFRARGHIRMLFSALLIAAFIPDCLTLTEVKNHCSSTDAQCRAAYYASEDGKAKYTEASFYWPLDLFLNDVKHNKSGAVIPENFTPQFKYMKEKDKNVLHLTKDYCVSLGNFRDQCLSDPVRCNSGVTIKFTLQINALSSSSTSYLLSSGCEGVNSIRTAGFVFLWNTSKFVTKACFYTHSWRIAMDQLYIKNQFVNVTITWTESKLSLFLNDYLFGTDTSVSSITWKLLEDHSQLKLGCPNSNSLGFQRPTMNISDVVVYYKDVPPKGVSSACLTTPLGVESKKLGNDRITASSSLSGSQFAPYLARLNNKPSDMTKDDGAWTASQTDNNQWLQFDFGKEVAISAVATQGHPTRSRYITLYSLAYQPFDSRWQWYKEGTIKEFQGNNDQNTVVFHYLRRPIRSRALKFIPIKWHGGISIRCEIYGCESPDVLKEPVSAISASSAYKYSTSKDKHTSSKYYVVKDTTSVHITKDISSVSKQSPQVVGTDESKSFVTVISTEVKKRHVSSIVATILSTQAASRADHSTTVILPTPSSHYFQSTTLHLPEESSRTHFSSSMLRNIAQTESTVKTLLVSSTAVHNPNSLEDDYVSQDIKSVQDKVEAVSSNDGINGISQDLLNAVNKRMSPKELTVVIDLLSELIESQQKLNVIMSMKEARMFMETITGIASNSLETKQLASWNKLKQPKSEANKLIDTLNNLAETIKKTLAVGVDASNPEHKMNVQKSSLEMEVGVFNEKQMDYVHFQSKQFPKASIRLPREIAQYSSDANSGIVGVNNIALDTVGEILKPRNAKTRRLNSVVISSKILNNTVNLIPLKDPLIMQFPHADATLKWKPVCSYLNVTAVNAANIPLWWNVGCNVVSSQDNITTCKCNHMTNFALIMDVHGAYEFISEKDRKILSIISIVGSLITIFCCLTTLISFSLTRKKTRTIFIHSNLIIALALVHVVFLISIWDIAVDQKDACKGIAIALHFFLLVMFSWMIVEGLHIYSKLVKVFYSTNRRKIYIVIGWVLPLLTIIIVTAVAGKRYGRAGKNSICWIDEEFLWVFVGPIGLVVLVNIFVLVSVVLVLMRRDRYKHRPKKERVLEQKLKTVFKVTFMLLPLLGLSWVVGYFMINKDSLIFMYLFNVLNGLQGVHIFVGYSLLDEDIRSGVSSALLRRSRRRHSTSKIQSNASGNTRNTIKLMQSSRKWSTESLGHIFSHRTRSLSNSSASKEKEIIARFESSCIHPTPHPRYDNKAFENPYVVTKLGGSFDNVLEPQLPHSVDQKLSAVPEENEEYRSSIKESTSKQPEELPNVRCNSWVQESPDENENTFNKID